MKEKNSNANVTSEDSFLLDDYAESCKACKAIRKAISLVADSAAIDCLLNAFETEQINRLDLKFKLQKNIEFIPEVKKFENWYLD